MKTIAFQIHHRQIIRGRDVVYYSYFGPDEGCFPPSLGWRRIMIDGRVFKVFGDRIQYENQSVSVKTYMNGHSNSNLLAISSASNQLMKHLFNA